MKDILILEDKTYISAKRVHELFGYTSDYVGQLCRAGKLDSKMVARSWFVTEKSVIDHLSLMKDAVKSKKEKRRIARKLSQQMVTGVVSAPSAPTAPIVPAPVAEIVTISPVIESSIPFIPIVEVVPQVISSPIITLNVSAIIEPVVVQAQVTEEIASPILVEETIEQTFVPVVHDIEEVSVKITDDKKLFPGFTFGNFAVVAGTMVVVIGILVGTFGNFGSHVATENTERTVAAVSETGFGFKILSFFSNISKLAVESVQGLFGKDEMVVVDETTDTSVQSDSIPFNGIAVTPSSNNTQQDELIKQKIRESFSDDVFVNPDSTGNSGVITPVFRKTKGSDYVYVMVPVNQK